jgi:hypothetical protein
MTAPTSYVSVKIMPEDAITADRLAAIEQQIAQLLSDQGVKAYLHTHQLVKAG